MRLGYAAWNYRTEAGTHHSSTGNFAFGTLQVAPAYNGLISILPTNRPNPVITLNIPRIATLKGVQRPYTFMVKHGFTPQTAKDLIAGRVRRLDFAHLEKLCRLFRCEPYDLYDYAPTTNSLSQGEDHLAFLAKPKVDQGIQSLIAGLSVKQMESLIADVAQRYSKP